MSFLQDSLHDMQAMLSGAPTAQPPPLDKLERSIITLLQNLRASRHPGHLDASRCSLSNVSLPLQCVRVCVRERERKNLGGGLVGGWGDERESGFCFVCVTSRHHGHLDTSHCYVQR